MATIKMKVDNSKINEIADAIREKTGTTQEYTLDEMPDKIRELPTSSGGNGALISYSKMLPNVTYGTLIED